MRIRGTAVTGVLIVGWYASSSGSNVVGALALRSMPFPLTLALIQLATAALFTPIAASRFRAPALHPALTLRALAPLAVAKLLTTVFSQISIWKVPVSYAHTVKATTPLWTALLSWMLFGERISRGVCGALALIAGGVALASATELSLQLEGSYAALAAAALLSLQHIYSKRVLKAGAHPLALLARLSQLALGPAAALWAWRELPGLLAASWDDGERLTALLVADALLSWLQAVLAVGVLARVTPLGYGVASAAKRAAVVALSLFVLGNPAPPLNLAGMAIAGLGVFAYNRAKAAPKSEDRQTLLPI